MFALSFSMAAFTINDSMVKLVGGRHPPVEVVFARSVLTLICLGIALLFLRQLNGIRAAFKGPVILRGVLDSLSSLLFVAALVHMPIAELSAIILATPLIITMLAVLIDKEEVGWRRWTAISVGLLGAIVIVHPDPWALDPWALLGLAAAFAAALRDLFTRRIDPSVSTLTVTFVSALVVMLVALPFGLIEAWQPLATQDFGLLLIAAVALSAGTFLLVIAYREAEISVVAPFRYMLLLWAGIAGYLIFGDLPDRWTLVGAGLIVGSGLYALHREARRHPPIDRPHRT
jgi:drug/metabolite transporter (DMT)-like permease